ncbi:hypothetical protein [Pseudobacteroides cellulosolvens]|nr:hypothetical protein [Pseudobacteroides cellulosolvens]
MIQKLPNTDASFPESSNNGISPVVKVTPGTSDIPVIGSILNETEDMESNQIDEATKKEMDKRLESIVSIKSTSSNPYDYIKNNKDFDYLVQQKNAGLKYMLQKFKASKENGLREYIMAIACSKILNENPDEKKWDTGKGWYEQYASKEFIIKSKSLKEIYILALDSMMPVDEGLNSEMKYISIDGTKLEYINESEKAEILTYFNKKYNIKTMDASFEKLQEMGMVKDINSIEGILLTISKVEIADKNSVIVNGYKFKSGLGAVGVQSKIINKDGKWKVESKGMTWIS